MVILNCTLIGTRSVVPILIEEWKTVGLLKSAIKENKHNTIKVKADKLLLFLAKTASGAWLESQDLLEKTYNEIESQYMEEELDNATDTISAKLPSTIPGGMIHVLVVDPSMRRIDVDTGYDETFRAYKTIADRLKATEEVKLLSNLVADVSSGVDSQPEEDTRFIVLENSSGTGKTQMAFNLAARGECDVFYAVCGSPGDPKQSVYGAYATRTDTFRACVKADVETMKTSSWDNSVGFIGQIRGHTTLALFGFILAALIGSNVTCKTVCRSDIEEELKRRKARDAKPFVFFLDDFPTTTTHLQEKELQQSELRLMRNVFRSFELPVVLSSTNGNAQNLFRTGSRSRGDLSDWCEVVPSLPQVVVTDAVPGTPELLMKIIEHSRPLFAEMALGYVRKNPYDGSLDLDGYLNGMAGKLALQFSWMKKRTVEFEVGQLCLLFGTSYAVLADEVDLIDGHFARLAERSAFKLQVAPYGQLLCGNYRPWECRAVMPSPTEDLLLHLTMAGGPSFRPFGDPLHAVVSKTRFPLGYVDTDQRSSKGMHLEALTAAAIVLASHAGGFGGVKFPTFLGNLLFELGVRGSRGDVGIAGCGELVVPFLSPPNTRWPSWLKETSVNFDDLIRTQTQDHSEFRTTSCLISGECKDCTNPLNLNMTRSIAMRVPADSTVHLVVTNTLPNQSLTGDGAWETFAREQRLQDVDIYRISNRSTPQGMTNQSSSTATESKKLVLFIELGTK